MVHRFETRVGGDVVLVSVLMSLYKPDESYLREQLCSIDAQDVDDMEIVIYNDCPQDVDRAEQCAALCPCHEVRYVHGEENLGYVRAFEKLVGLARGTYLVFADQDDAWEPGRVSKCLEQMRQGHVLCSCDRSVIDAEGKVLVPSWRAAHAKDVENTWHTGDYYVPKAAFTCFSIGMATMVRADVARDLRPYLLCTGHDKWIALCANEVGSCAFVDEPLVRYRRHASNVSGTFSSMTCKQDWYDNRTKQAYRLVQEFCARFPESKGREEMLAFATARINRSVVGMWRYRRLAPIVADFEIALKFMPEFVFRRLVGA